MRLSAFAARHPVPFALGATIAWLVLLALLTGAAASLLRKPFVDAVPAAIGRLAVAACVAFAAWRLGWFRSSGIGRPGRARVWLLAFVGLAYSAAAALYSFYGRPWFDASTLTRPGAPAIVLTGAAVGLCEELLFRGIVLDALRRAWATTRAGLFGALVFTALLFGVLHLVQTLGGLPLASGLILVAQTVIVSFWWGSLVAAGGSLWPAVMLHAAVNAIVPLQGLSTPLPGAGAAVYALLLALSVPLGIVGVALAARAPLVTPPTGNGAWPHFSRQSR